MTSQARRLTWLAAAAIIGAITLWTFTQGEPNRTMSVEALEIENHVDHSPADSAAQGQVPVAAEPVPPSSPQATDRISDDADPKMRKYALGLHELKGLPANVTPGTEFELWAAIEPPDGEAHYTGKIAPRVVVTDVIAPITPDGPVSVIIAVPLKHMSKLVFAHRWGTFSVALL